MGKYNTQKMTKTCEKWNVSIHSAKNIEILFRNNIQKDGNSHNLCSARTNVPLLFPHSAILSIAIHMWFECVAWTWRERANGIECISFGTQLLVSVAICNSLHVLNAQQHTKSRSYNIFNSVWKRVCFTCNNKKGASASARSPQNHIHRKSFTLFGKKCIFFCYFVYMSFNVWFFNAVNSAHTDAHTHTWYSIDPHK